MITATDWWETDGKRLEGRFEDFGKAGYRAGYTNGYESRAEEIKDWKEERDRLAAALAETDTERDRLLAWLQKIDGGDNPCTDEKQLRQWAYEAVVLGRDAGERG